MRPGIILCADDYALTPGVSQAIRMLAAAERISATGAIVTRPDWPLQADALKPLVSSLATGLHLNFTLGAPLDRESRLTRTGLFPRLPMLIAKAFTGKLDPAAIGAEIEHQLDAFEAGLGAPPDFVDGHEHVHVLPVIRPALLAILKRRYGGKTLLVRDPSPSFAQIFQRQSPAFKSFVLRVLSRGMRLDIESQGFVSNDSFGGITAFASDTASVAADFAAASAAEGWRPLVMCHPGFPDAELARIDPITTRRQTEFDVLMRQPPVMLNVWRPVRSPSGAVLWPVPAVLGATS